MPAPARDTPSSREPLLDRLLLLRGARLRRDASQLLGEARARLLVLPARDVALASR